MRNERASNNDIGSLEMSQGTVPNSPHQLTNQFRVFVNIPLPEAFKKDDDSAFYSFPNNSISTAKYTALNFLPKNIFEQFRRVANFFFLGIVIIQLIPTFQIGSAFFVVAPLAVIIGATSVKDAFEDYKRHISDSKLNSSKVWALGNWTNVQYVKKVSLLQRLFKKQFRKSFDDSEHNCEDTEEEELPEFIAKAQDRASITSPTTTPSNSTGGGSVITGNMSHKLSKWQRFLWRDLVVGDFVFICKDEDIPADIIVLSTSEPNQVCYVETKNLDGETNLKMRQGPPELCHLRTPQDCTRIKFFIDSEKPNNHLYSYHGVIHVQDYGLEEVEDSKSKSLSTNSSANMRSTIPLDATSLLLRGCQLRNTQFIIGLVIATGAETKLMLNSGETPSKRTKIEKIMNPQVCVMYVYMIFNFFRFSFYQVECVTLNSLLKFSFLLRFFSTF
jgi:phospholipid-translocating ATPase